MLDSLWYGSELPTGRNVLQAIKKTFNEDWASTNDAETEVPRLKDGQTALAYQQPAIWFAGPRKSGPSGDALLN